MKSRVNSVAFGELSDCDYVSELLHKNGIVIVPDFFKENIVNAATAVLYKVEREVGSFLNSGKDLYESKKILFQKGSKKLSGYHQLSEYEKTVVQVREGQDHGMVDIFNIDIAYPELSVLRDAYEKSDILRVVSNNNMKIGFKNLNFYLNDSILSTRGFHADSYAPQLKAFVYLTDCLELDDGPYTYVKGSHKDGAYRRFNQAASEHLQNKTEAPFVRREDIIPVLAGKGSLVISDQSGFHRGFPQGEGRSRAISVMNIK